MKHTATKHSKNSEQVHRDYITKLQRKCISDISDLCTKRRHSSKKRRLFGCISTLFFFVSVLTVFFGIILKLIHGKDDKVYSVISVISAAVSIISGILLEIESEKEKAFSDEVKLLEDVIDSSENI